MAARISDEPPSFLAAVSRPALGVVAACLLVLAGFGARYAGEDQGRWLDQTARRLFGTWFPLPRGLARQLIELADPVPMMLLVAVLAGLCLLLHRPRLAVLAVLGPALTGLTTTLLKPVVGRTKNGDLAYPSGHLGATTALVLVAALLLVSVLAVGVAAAVALVAALTGLAAGVMALAMVTVNYHYLTDAVGGFCVAVAVVLGLALLVERRPRGAADPSQAENSL